MKSGRPFSFFPALMLGLIVPLAAHAQQWSYNNGALPVDLLIPMNTSTPGTSLTTTILANGTVAPSNVTATWSNVEAGLTVGANQSAFTNLGPIQINGGGTLYPAGSLNYNNIAHADSSNNTTVTLTFGGTGGPSTGCSGGVCHTASVLFPFTTGMPYVGGTGNDYDMFFMFEGSNGDYAGIQLNDQSSSCPNSGLLPSSGSVNVRIEVKPTAHSPCIALVPRESYYASLTWDIATGVATMYVYTATGTRVPCVAGSSSTGACNSDGSVTITAGDTDMDSLAYAYIGNNENWNNDSNTTYYQNIAFNWSNTTFGPSHPFFWTQTDPWAGVLAPARGASWGPPGTTPINTNATTTGVAGGIPARATICQTLGVAGQAPSYVQSVTTAQIESALSTCSGTNETVLLEPGTYSSATGGIAFGGYKNVTLRGSGANQTLFSPTGGWSVYNTQNACGNAASCGSNAAPNLTTWFPGGGVSGGAAYSGTAQYPQGINTITLSAVANLAVGNLIVLDQLDPSTDYGGFLVSQIDSGGTGVSPGFDGPYSTQGNGANVARGSCHGGTPCNSQAQTVTVTQCDGVTTTGHTCSSGSNITIFPGLELSTWGFDLGGNSLSASAWWPTSEPQGIGIEDLGLNMVNCSRCVAIDFLIAQNSWVKGVAVTNGSPSDEGLIRVYSGGQHLQFENNYIGVVSSGTAGVYGFEIDQCSDCLVENNIVQGVTTPFIDQSSDSGDVWGYNYAINGFYSSSLLYNIPARGDHGSGLAKLLSEGNITNGHTQDNIHGTANLITDFRNNFWGLYPECADSSSFTGSYGACTQNYYPELDLAFHRFSSMIGNVLGTTGVNTVYTQTTYGSTPDAVIVYNAPQGSPVTATDTNDQQTLMLWGNADPVTGFGSPRFNCSEVMEGTAFSSLNAVWIPLYNPCPLNDTLPASFYYRSKPSWWPTNHPGTSTALPWPIIGPDITDGNLLQCTSGTYTRSIVTLTSQCAGGTSAQWSGGLANSNPAMDCYLNVMGGNPDGTGGPYNFNEKSCYPSGSAQALAPPTNLNAVVQ